MTGSSKRSLKASPADTDDIPSEKSTRFPMAEIDSPRCLCIDESTVGRRRIPCVGWGSPGCAASGTICSWPSGALEFASVMFDWSLSEFNLRRCLMSWEGRSRTSMSVMKMHRKLSVGSSETHSRTFDTKLIHRNHESTDELVTSL